jgi:hypothetical protein
LQQTGHQAALSLQPGMSAVNFASNWTSSCSKPANREVSGSFVKFFGFNLVSTCSQAGQLFILQQIWAQNAFVAFEKQISCSNATNLRFSL